MKKIIFSSTLTYIFFITSGVSAQAQTSDASQSAARALSNCLVGTTVIRAPNGTILSEEPTYSISESDCSILQEPMIFNAEVIQENPDIGISGLKIDALNLQAQNIHKVPDLKRKFSLSGKGITAGVWDEGVALPNHVEFAGSRVKVEPQKFINFHGTHVAGTIGASGVVDEAQGMAPDVKIKSYDWTDDTTEMGVDTDVSVTNHSYAVPAGWFIAAPSTGSACNVIWRWRGNDKDTIDWHFGKYRYSARNFDKVILDKPNLSVFTAAGNEGGGINNPENYRNMPPGFNSFDGTHCIKKNGKLSLSKKVRISETGINRYDNMTSQAIAKNVITVGAATDINPEFTKSDIEVTDFSGFGPTDDGRIKPDIIANGFSVYSTYVPERCDRGSYCWPNEILENERDKYESSNGTSMATPVVAGVGALLNELAMRPENFGRTLYADEMKAVLIHSAISPRDDNGPSYSHGWGLLDALAAGNIVEKSSQIDQIERKNYKSNNQTIGRKFMWADSSNALRITTVWLDDPDFSERIWEETLNDRTPNLILDVDTKITSPSGKDYFPWKLDPENPLVDASNSNNNVVDNVERIDIPAELHEDGEWTLTIDFSKISSGSRSLDLAMAHNVSWN